MVVPAVVGAAEPEIGVGLGAGFGALEGGGGGAGVVIADVVGAVELAVTAGVVLVMAGCLDCDAPQPAMERAKNARGPAETRGRGTNRISQF